MYESYNGREFACNPHAILRELLSRSEYDHLRHVIAVIDTENAIANRYRDHPRVRIVELGSDEYIRYEHQCKYFFNNASFRPYITKKPGQVYVTTWHSTLLKHLARDAGSPWDAQNVSRALMLSDYFISPNRFTTERLLKSHGVDGVMPGTIAEFGYPRNDLTISSDIERVREKIGLARDQNLVVYAPTWRGGGGEKG
jgi:CDP-glycerol glycerophosphotransferase